MMHQQDDSQTMFQKLKVFCVPLMGNSLLTPESIPLVSKLLTSITTTLRDAKRSGHTLTPALISYVFFPLSSVLRRNPMSALPNQILEKILVILRILCEDWWWDFDEKTWEQIFMLCGAIIGDLDRTGNVKVRDDETKDAAAQCLWTIVRERNPYDDDTSGHPHIQRAERQWSSFRSHAQTLTFIPVLGQTVNSLLNTTASPHLGLQRSSLKLLHVLIKDYLLDGFVPSILPGVVSSMSKIALNIEGSKEWAKGEVVAGALTVMQEAIIRSMGDKICVQEGAVAAIDDLEDLADLLAEPKREAGSSSQSPYMTLRTSAWVRGTASQLHIAMNSLTPLINHPTPAALLSLSTFSAVVVVGTTLTVPRSQPLLISFLLSLSGSAFDTVSHEADAALRRILTPPSSVRHSLLQILLELSRDNLTILPRLIPSHSDAKVEHVANLVEGVCRLAIGGETMQLQGITSISAGVGKLLGPNGGIEKWGWSLLSVLEFATVPIAETRNTAALMLESNAVAVEHISFPKLGFKHITSHSAYAALERMFRSLGRAAGEDCLFAVEWFVNVGENGGGHRAVAALWCACRLLEGAAVVALEPDSSHNFGVVKRSRRTERLARGIARSVGDLWMDVDEGEQVKSQSNTGAEMADDETILVEHIKGLVSIRAAVDFQATSKLKPAQATAQPILHRCLCLQLLSVTAGILEARFTPLLLHTLYPILNAIVSQSPLVSISGLAALYSITSSTSYASPANLLLSNFDYALDAVSRHLNRRWLDVDATKVLAVLVRQVGRDVVRKAGDVVEECFDRLDEFHGYEIIVDGLVAVLGEVVQVIEGDEENQLAKDARSVTATPLSVAGKTTDSFLDWYAHRRDAPEEMEDIRDSSYPREAWDKKDNDEPEHTRQEQVSDPSDEPPPTPAQALTKQIVSRSIYFLTHNSPVIRARILLLLSAAVPVLPESALLPSIHNAWPFILNRLADPEPFVVSAAASLVEALASHVGDFMYRRIWEDIWPRFRTLLKKLEAADATNALARRGHGAVGTESAYTYSHRLYRSLLKTMTAAARGVQAQDSAIWEVLLLFRRFLHNSAHEELQTLARDMYTAFGANNEDAVWLALSATQGQLVGVDFLREERWDIGRNVALILQHS